MTAVQSDFPLDLDEDGVITVSLAPPTSISGMTLQYTMMRRFYGAPIVSKSAASGFNNVSGINVVDGANGVLTIQLFQSETSGLDAGNYAYLVARTDSGVGREITKGYRLAN